MCVGQMVRPQHMPPAQLHRALPAASCEGHVCTAGPGLGAGLLQGQVGGGRKESLALLVGCGERPEFWPWPPGSTLGHLVYVQISSLPSKLEAPQPLWRDSSLSGQMPKVAVRSPQGLAVI